MISLLSFNFKSKTDDYQRRKFLLQKPSNALPPHHLINYICYNPEHANHLHGHGLKST